MTILSTIIMFNQKLHIYQLIPILGLIPYAVLSILTLSIIPLIVFINGIWYWTTQSSYSYYSDITYNTLAILYVNYLTTFQPKTLYLTMIATSIWILNSYSKNTITSSIIHVYGVQFPFIYCLLQYFYESNLLI